MSRQFEGRTAMALISTCCVLHRAIKVHVGPRIAARSLGMQNKQRRQLTPGASATTPAFRAYDRIAGFSCLYSPSNT